MRITDLLDPRSVLLGTKAQGKEDLIRLAVDQMEKGDRLRDRKVYEEGVFARESKGTTGVGEGVAIPHAKSAGVKEPGLAAITIPKGTDFDSLDGEPTRLLFLIAAPEGKADVHLQILSKLSAMLMNPDFIRQLVEADSVDRFLKIIDQEEEERDRKEKEEEADRQKEREEKEPQDGPSVPESTAPAADTAPLILAVTGCPTGIAHTFMAAEALTKKAKELGYRIKVETRGAGGAKNVLTDSEIEEAKGIIVASDTNVPMNRFDGKRVIQTQVSDGISKPEELITRVLADGPLFHGQNKGAEPRQEKDAGSLGHRIYAHLMNGFSHMLPFVVGGGILIALAFLIDGFSVDVNSLPMDQRQNFGTITPLAATFKKIGDLAFSFMLPILSGFIALSIADRPALAPGFVGGAFAAAGKSGFLGALVAGFVAGYLIQLLEKVTEKMPKSIDGVRSILIYPLFGILLIGLFMGLFVEPLVGAINTALNQGLRSMSGASSILLGLVLGGMMSVDMGGPFNKAAYVFGTASIASQNYNIMAAVMVGGMVPPCAIALACWLFPKKFTDAEVQSAPANMIMGLAFITEGAIPFAASDPVHVLPSCIVGSAIAGGLSMAFSCTLMAPHGGIFVFPVVGNALLYILSLVIGTVVAAVLLGLLRKQVR